MKIYTKTGDKGQTSLFTGKRVLKNDVFIEALGTVDECNSALGVAISLMKSTPELEKIHDQLEIIQHTLFDVGAAIATPRTQAIDSKIEKTRFGPEDVKILENWIVWIAANLVYIPLMFARGLPFTAIQYTVFTVLAVQGYRSWKRSWVGDQVAGVSGVSDAPAPVAAG